MRQLILLLVYKHSVSSNLDYSFKFWCLYQTFYGISHIFQIRIQYLNYKCIYVFVF